MMKTDLAATTPPQLAVFGSFEDVDSNENACPLTQEILDTFERVTGWRAEFREPEDANPTRADQGSEHQAQLKIVDMSASWPGKKPTAHRGLCDHLIGLFGQLMTELNETRQQRDQARSTLAQFQIQPEDDQEFVADSFPPLSSTSTGQSSDFALDESSSSSHRFLYESDFVEVLSGDAQSSVDQNPESSDDDDFELNGCPDSDDEFTVQQNVIQSIPQPTEANWKNWSLSGTSGIASDTYLDWYQGTEKLEIVVGKIERGRGGNIVETSVEIDPENCRYRVTGDTSIKAFFTWDRRGGKTQAANLSGAWNPIYPGTAIICTTTPAIHMPDPQIDLPTNPSSEALTQALTANLDSDERVLVIKRGLQ